jgi:hypothetical protein
MFQRIRKEVASSMKPQVIEVQVESLGGYVADIGKDSERYINYHAGGVRMQPHAEGILVNNSSDPVFELLVKQHGA